MRASRWEKIQASSPHAGFLVVAGILVGFWSCAPIGHGTPSLSIDFSSQRHGTRELVQILAQRIDRFRSLRSLARVTYWKTEEKGSIQGAFLVRRPDRLRMETLSLLGAILVLTVDGNEVVGFYPREGTFYRGRASKKNLARYIQIPLELRDLTSLLMGLPPVEIHWPWEGENLRIQRSLSGGGSEVVTFDPDMGIPIGWERVGPDGEVELSAVFSDFISTPVGPFPLRISLESYGSQEERLEIRYQEPEVNVALSASLFVQQKPSHVREFPLESLGG
ncbi:MAG: DUF4292 domain-containing protein [Deltaproteobacteria bacterium]|nr:DUF4292 domain-containing protein [Deltaproteobacteria bacterium]